MTSIIIPAHNEESGLGRLLPMLVDGTTGSAREIIVVCNGCDDGSVAVARSFEPAVVVFETSEASKATALRIGNSKAQSFPRVYMDSDVEIDVESVGLLEESLQAPGVLAAGPRRVIARDGVSRPARWYYDIWEMLPQVREGLFGRGVIAVSREGYERIQDLPHVIADDLVISEAFAPGERVVEDSAGVVIFPARTWRSLVRRRIRVQAGTRQSRRMGLAKASTSISLMSLLTIARQDPRTLGKVLIFGGTALWVRVRAQIEGRRSAGPRWYRDESSRRNG